MEKLIFFLKKGIAILFFLGAGSLFAQLTINPGANALLLAGTIQGSGATITNPVRTAPNSHTATFDNGNSTNLGINKGIILSTGTAAAINGAATSSANTNSSGAGFALLDPLAGAPTRDAARLEFDVVPTCEYLQIRFVFGTEEYPDYVGTTYNDAFGFFISGANPNGGTYTNQNFALVPASDLPISVNTINNGEDNSGPCMNCAYYNDNSAGASLKYNGFTTPMTSSVKVTPGATYHLVLAIADGNEGNEDAAVMIEFGGLSCPAALPVEFASFTGEKINKGNLLKWATASETNSNYFSIERSSDGKKFEEIEKVTAATNSKNMKQYEFLDKHKGSPAISPNLFYRIRQVDMDGREAYADKVIQIENSYSDSHFFVNSVLSEEGMLNISFTSSEEDQVEFFICDANGRVLSHADMRAHSGYNEFNFNMSGEASGIFFIKMISSAEMQCSKISKP